MSLASAGAALASSWASRTSASPLAYCSQHPSRPQQSKGRKEVQPPSQADVARMTALAGELTPPSFAAYLLTAVWSVARPGELDALRWEGPRLSGPRRICIESQLVMPTPARITTPKHDSKRERSR